MERPQPTEYNPGYQKYLDLVMNGEYLELLRRNGDATVEFFERIPPERHSYRYAEGKWTIKDVLMHIIDTERVFAYRALAAARGDETPVYRMDEELYARNVDVNKRTMENLISEFRVVRTGSEYLFENVNDAQSKRWCNVVTHPMSVRAIGYFLIGHVEHHVGIISQRYLKSADFGSQISN
jgi:uncharacterized damage-inducible protein DinB